MKKYTLEEINIALNSYKGYLISVKDLKSLLKQARKKLKEEIEVTTDSKFKVGDEVVIIANRNGHEFEIGQKVRISGLYDKKDGYYVTDGSEEWSVDESEIREVPRKSKFKVGDEVVIVANNHNHGFKIGQKVVIEQIWGGGAYSARKIGGDWWGVTESEIVAAE